MQVREVVHRPRGDELSHRDDAESGMAATAFEIRRLKIERLQFDQIVGAQPPKQIEKLGKRLALALALLRETIERLECARIPELQNHLRAWNPVRPLAVNQMTDDVEDSPRAWTFVSLRPRFRQIGKKGVERGRCALEQRHSVAHATGDA